MKVLNKKIWIPVIFFFSTNIFSQVMNVDNYGAAGDGITDDRAAIQNVLDDLKLSGGELQFTSGKTYIIDGGLNLYHYLDTKNYLITTTSEDKATIKIKDNSPIEWGNGGIGDLEFIILAILQFQIYV